MMHQGVPILGPFPRTGGKAGHKAQTIGVGDNAGHGNRRTFASITTALGHQPTEEEMRCGAHAWSSDIQRSISPELVDCFRRFRMSVVVLRVIALCLALLLIGGSSCLVQVLGWSVMVAQRAPLVGFQAAVISVMTGTKPCGFCVTAAALRDAENGQPDAAGAIAKLKQPDVAPPIVVTVLGGGITTQCHPAPTPDCAPGRYVAPEVPPPRPHGI